MFSHREAVEDLLRGYIATDWLDILDLETLERAPAEHIGVLLTQRKNDIIWRVRWKHDGQEDWLFIYLLMEFQSTIDATMPLRLAEYVTLLYQSLIKSRVVPTGQDLALPPVVPIVLYNGRERWWATRHLAELIQAPVELADLQMRISYVLIDETRMDTTPAAERNLVAMIFQLEQSQTPEDIQAVTQAMADALTAEGQSSLWVHEFMDYDESWGERRLDNQVLWQGLAERYDQYLTELFPEIDYLVLTTTETQHRIAPGDPLLAKVITVLDAACKRHGKRLIYRNFRHGPDWLKDQHYENLLAEIPTSVILQSKTVVQDFHMRGVLHPLIGMASKRGFQEMIALVDAGNARYLVGFDLFIEAGASVGNRCHQNGPIRHLFARLQRQTFAVAPGALRIDQAIAVSGSEVFLHILRNPSGD